jgi:hypothetical protein
MKHSEFYIGLEFLGAAGYQWRCTDVGTRTITAIQMTDVTEEWLAGPPYMVTEEVFDEKELEHCHMTTKDAILSAREDKYHPGFSNDSVNKMMKESFELYKGRKYLRKNLLRYDRLNDNGEILHPYSAFIKEEEWIIRVYSLYSDQYLTMPENDFLKLKLATIEDYKNSSKNN